MTSLFTFISTLSHAKAYRSYKPSLVHIFTYHCHGAFERLGASSAY